MLIYFLVYTDRFIKKDFAAMTYGPVILIRPKYRGDVGLLEHEKVHVRQWWKCPIGFPWLYKFDDEFRYNAELEAYAEQNRHYPDDRSLLFASFLANNYDIDGLHIKTVRDQILKLQAERSKAP